MEVDGLSESVEMLTSLWRDTTSGLYLLGSIHFLSTSAYPLPLQVESAYSEASTLVFEARSDRQLNQALGTLPGRATLSTVLDEDLYGRLAEAAGVLGIDLEDSSSLRPVAIAFNILRAALQALDHVPSQGVDSHLLARADADGKEVNELEDLNYLTRRITILGMETEREFLRMILDDLPTLQEDQQVLIEAWRGGDFAALEALAVRKMDPYPRVKRVMLAERNRNWLPRLRDYRRSGRGVLVVVGVGHLVGEGNLRDLLEARGARLEQL